MITSKLHHFAENACVNWLWQQALKWVFVFSQDFEQFRDATQRKLLEVDRNSEHRFSALKNLTQKNVSSILEAYKGTGKLLRDVSQQVSIL